MVSIPEIRERLASFLRDKLKDEDIVVNTDYYPVIDLDDTQTAITVQPVSFSAVFSSRASYTVEPKISVTVSKRISGTSRQETGDSILTMCGRIINELLGKGFSGVIVKSVEVDSPVLSEENISGANVCNSRLVFTLIGFENRGA